MREALKIAAGQHTRLRLLHLVDGAAPVSALATFVDRDALLQQDMKDGLDLLSKARQSVAEAGVQADTVQCIAHR